MKYAEIFNKAAIVRNIPLICEGRELPSGMNAIVVLTRVQYDKHMHAFEEEMNSVLKNLKKEGFDERSERQERLKDIDSRAEAAKKWKKGDKDENGNLIEKPAAPTPEELKEAEEIRKEKDAYDEELEKLNSDYGEAHDKKMGEEIKFDERKFTVEQFESIIKMIGIEGDIEVNGNKIPKTHFINMIGALFVE